jgi:hypothetical protein
MTRRRPWIDPRVVAILDESGAPYEIVEGKNHPKLFVAGRMVVVFPRTSKGENWSAAANALAAVRRAVAAWKAMAKNSSGGGLQAR